VSVPGEWGPSAAASWRKRPVEIRAYRTPEQARIETLEGVMTAQPGDWIITGVEGERYPCRDSIFRVTYEPVPDEPAES